MKYVFEGPALAKVLQENRIRIARGDLRVTPLVEADEDTKEPEVEDTKDVVPTDEKKPAKKAKK